MPRCCSSLSTGMLMCRSSSQCAWLVFHNCHETVILMISSRPLGYCASLAIVNSVRLHFFTRHCGRVVKAVDSKSTGFTRVGSSPASVVHVCTWWLSFSRDYAQNDCERWPVLPATGLQLQGLYQYNRMTVNDDRPLQIFCSFIRILRGSKRSRISSQHAGGWWHLLLLLL